MTKMLPPPGCLAITLIAAWHVRSVDRKRLPGTPKGSKKNSELQQLG